MGKEITAASAVFFDLDGTLTDPEQGIVRSIRFAFDRLGVHLPDDDDLRWCIGPPLLDSMKTLLRGRADAEEAVRLYRVRYAETGLFENAVYDGIPELLDRLAAGDHRLYVATSKPHVYAERILRHFNLDRFFRRVFGSEFDGTRADKRDLLAHALIQTGEPAASSIMVGDRHHDMAGATANGMRPIGVTYGFGSRAELLRAGAHIIVASPHELADAIERPAAP